MIIKVILGSTRPNRFGPKVAQWIMDATKEFTDATFELVDLAEVNLPLLDEPVPAKQDKYSNEHTKRWAEIVGGADGFVFIVPEYNHGVGAAVKNAFDYLYKEWNYKPVAFASYGADAGGARSVEHLRLTASYLKMYDVCEQVNIPFYWNQLDKEGNLTTTEGQNDGARAMLQEIIFWTEHLQPVRKARQQLG
ncbi:MAG TPA: NAD(P)H-dependent oxidoreductase [Candidatus Saccharimonadales bacterium]|nr:NAD(P)H-dependent oxidoreductase [Candidatus Saccharimonadales bacterium]